MAYIKYNYLGSTTQSQANILSDVASILSGQTTKTNLFGHINLSSAAVGITNTSTTVTWVGADDGSVVAARKNIEVGQAVYGVGIPDGTTVATITNQTGFTLSAAATATNAAAILTLDETATQPTSTIGSTTKAISTSNTSTNLTVTGMCTATLGIMAVGASVEGFGIPAGTTISSITSANVLVMSAAATATVSPASIVISPPSTNIVCDTVNTSILTTYYAAGWKLWDMYGNAGVANIWIMRAPLYDDATQFKYIGLDVSSDGFLQIHNYESWNQSTHAATNQATALGTTWQQRLTKTVAASIIISSSARHLLMQSNVAAGIGASNTTEWTALFERTRRTPWDTVANAYPPTVLTTGFLSFATGGTTNFTTCPRYKNPAGGDYTTTNATLSCAVLGFSSNVQSGASYPVPIYAGGAQSNKIPDGLGGYYTPLNEIYYQSPQNSFLGGSVSTYCDVWQTVSYPKNLDETVANGKTYVVLNNINNASACFLAIPKG